MHGLQIRPCTSQPPSSAAGSACAPRGAQYERRPRPQPQPHRSVTGSGQVGPCGPQRGDARRECECLYLSGGATRRGTATGSEGRDTSRNRDGANANYGGCARKRGLSTKTQSAITKQRRRKKQGTNALQTTTAFPPSSWRRCQRDTAHGSIS
ncbi:hypothetical protein C8R45DRAFT_561436 [Mycena sanguinolenta]|nr:hypothetical protein C8R45DRAFT_561436 [Mycena sanguinolenta]